MQSSRSLFLILPMFVALAACQQQSTPPEPTVESEPVPEIEETVEQQPAPDAILSADPVQRAMECADAELLTDLQGKQATMRQFVASLQHHILSHAVVPGPAGIDERIADLANLAPARRAAIRSDTATWAAACRYAFPSTVAGQGAKLPSDPLHQEILCATIPRFIAIAADGSESLIEADRPGIAIMQAQSDRASDRLTDERLAEAGITGSAAFTRLREKIWIEAARRGNLLDQIEQCPQ